MGGIESFVGQHYRQAVANRITQSGRIANQTVFQKLADHFSIPITDTGIMNRRIDVF